MVDKTQISWTNYSWNPWQGCHKISSGCKFCYMHRDKIKYGQIPDVVVKSAQPTFNKPFKIEKPSLIFTCSWSDWFIEEADGWRSEAWEVIKNTPQHTYQILTKRPERIADCLPDDWGAGYPNVWLGVSAENDKEFRIRSQILCETPAKIRFISAEPLLGPIDMIPLFKSYFQGINWVIIGGESGNNTGKYRYRECVIEWIVSIITQCTLNEVPVFVKQMGTHLAKEMDLKDRHGGDMSEWTETLQVRELPINSLKTTLL